MPSTPQDPHFELPSWGDFACSAQESRHPEMWNGCVGAWLPVLGPTGVKLMDVSGFHNHGTLTNMDPANDWVKERTGHAIQFRGTTDERVQVDSVGTLGFNDTNECTVITKAAIGGQNQGLFELAAVSTINTGFLMFSFAATTIRFRTFTGGQQEASAAIFPPVTGIWIGTYGINKRRAIYRDGVLLNSNTTSVVAFDNTLTGELRIGHLMGSTFPLNGAAEYSILLNRHLTDEEIVTRWQNPLDMFLPNVETPRGLVVAAPTGIAVLRRRREAA